MGISQMSQEATSRNGQATPKTGIQHYSNLTKPEQKTVLFVKYGPLNSSVFMWLLGGSAWELNFVFNLGSPLKTLYFVELEFDPAAN